MQLDALAELKYRVSLLSHHEQLRLMEHLAHELREEESRSRKEFEEGVAAMAADPDIQREIKAIHEEFAGAELDGLENV